METAIISGIEKVYQNGFIDTYDNETGEELDIPDGMPIYEGHYIIDNISIPINIINLPSEIDNELKKLIEKSFQLFWIDNSSCANKIRISLEYLLRTKLKVKNKIKCKDKEKSTQTNQVFYNKTLTLGEKIGELKTNAKFLKYKHIADNLKAIKWIGNEGSHNGSVITRLNLIEVYRILEVVLTEIYSTNKLEIAKLTKKINNKHGRKK